MAFSEATEEFLWKCLFLPGLYSVPFLRDERLRDGGVQGGQTLSGGEETLPRPHEGAIKWPWGRRQKIHTEEWHREHSTELSHRTNRELMTFICPLKSFQQSQMTLFNINKAVIFNLIAAMIKKAWEYKFSVSRLPISSFSYLRESTMDFHLLLHWLSCWAYCFSTFALSMKQATMSLQAWKDWSVRCTVRT